MLRPAFESVIILKLDYYLPKRSLLYKLRELIDAPSNLYNEMEAVMNMHTWFLVRFRHLLC